MVSISLLVVGASILSPAVAGESMARYKRAHHKAVVDAATSVPSSAAVAAAPTSSFTGTLPASIESIIATISSGEGNPTATQALATTFTAGAINPSISGAPPLPTSAVNPADYPPLDKIPPLDSAEAKAWIAKIDMSKVPNIPKTVNSAACGDAANAQNLRDAAKNGWWTCGAYVRDTDLTTCPDKNTWGLSYDDGPSPYTPKLLSFLDKHNLKSTFFVVGSRAISRPDMLQTEYMSGHQLSVHTWSHPPLTTLSNEEIIVELAWTREAIRRITGVSPNTMRPPYGDIDDRVRAICTQMNLTPIIWTGLPDGTSYDTEDWQIAGGVVTAPEVVVNFEGIINNATQLDTGYIVLAHDLYQQSVDISTEVILPFALAHEPKQNLMPIITCLKQPLGDAYVETNRNLPNGRSDPTATNSGPAPSGTNQAVSGSGSNGSNAASGLAIAHFAALGAAVFFGALSFL